MNCYNINKSSCTEYIWNSFHHKFYDYFKIIYRIIRINQSTILKAEIIKETVIDGVCVSTYYDVIILIENSAGIIIVQCDGFELIQF